MTTTFSTFAHLAESYHAASERFGNSVPKEQRIIDVYPFTSWRALIVVNVLYLLSVVGLKWIMQNLVDEPFDLKSYRVVYNASCVALSLLTAYLMASGAYREDFTFVCNNDFPGRVYPSFQMAKYTFFISKLFEFQDTWIMILRKSFKQVSFLHVYHHCSITFVVFSYLRFSGGGDEWVPAFLNSVVHVFMYTHYLVATLGYSTWWKPYLTTMQIAQFIVIFAQSCIGLYLHCGWADFLNVLQLFYMSTMIVLFSNFYVEAYQHKKKKGD